MNEEKGEDESELACFERKSGEKMRNLKCLQVDRRYKKVLKGKKESIRSRSSTGSLRQILRSISGVEVAGDILLTTASSINGIEAKR